MNVIQVENISKRYIISHKSQPKSKYNSLGETLTNKFKLLFSKSNNQSLTAGNRKEEFWALQNISLEVNQGDKIGIIGRNGAGKTTILKILSRITEPTNGVIRIKGRVASLLEVGTGFHPELTGRENIYLNGAILGMKKNEIKSKFDEIVAFSEIERFLDTPVKRYSSGMYVRLAFSVAAHLEPEILLVDEVLAVGDFKFQKKCLGKMQDVSKEGRTIIFVSHDMNAIKNLCKEVILLDKGKIEFRGETIEAIKKYFNYYSVKGNEIYNTPKNNNNEIQFYGIKIFQNNIETEIIDCRQPFYIKVYYILYVDIKNFRVNLLFKNEYSEYIFGTSDLDFEESETTTKRGEYISKVEIPSGLLKIGELVVCLLFDIPNTKIFLKIDNIKIIRIMDNKETSNSERHKRKGLLAPLLKWERVME